MQNKLTEKTIQFDEIKQFLDQQNVSLAFSKIDDFNALLFGRYLISYNKKTSRFAVKIKKYHSLTESSWVCRPKKIQLKIFRGINFYYCRAINKTDIGSIFNQLVDSVIDDTLADILVNYRIEGVINCHSGVPFYFRRKWEKTVLEEPSQINLKLVTVPHGYNDVYRYADEFNIVEKNKVISFYTDSKGNMHPIDPELSFLGEETIFTTLRYKSQKGRYSRGWHNASKALGCWIRNIAHQGYLSVMLRTFLYRPFYDLNITDYHYVISRKLSLEAGSLLPLMTHSVFTVKRMKSFNYSNKSFMDILHTTPRLEWITKNDISLLRKVPRSLTASIFRHMSETDAGLNLKILLFLQRTTLVKYFPQKVISNLIRQIRVDLSEKNHHRILLLWMGFYQSVWRDIGYLKSIDQWEHYITQLVHALDYARFSNAVISKSYNWHSVQMCVLRWDEQRRQQWNDPAPSLTWPPSLLDQATVDDFDFKEICTSTELGEEGYVMEHCVAHYAASCYESRYRVFTVKSAIERATLGVHVDAQQSSADFDQVRSYGNTGVSRELLKASKIFIQRLNNKNLSKVA